MASILPERGADANQRDSYYETTRLIKAVGRGLYSLAHMFLEKGRLPRGGWRECGDRIASRLEGTTITDEIVRYAIDEAFRRGRIIKILARAGKRPGLRLRSLQRYCGRAMQKP